MIYLGKEKTLCAAVEHDYCMGRRVGVTRAQLESTTTNVVVLHLKKQLIICIAINFFSKNSFSNLFTSLECKHNKLQFSLRIKSIKVRKQKATSITCSKESIQDRNAFSLKIEDIQSDSR